MTYGVLAVLVVSHGGVAVQLLKLEVDFVGQLEKFKQTVAVGKLALEVAQSGVLLGQLVESLFPFVGCGEDVAEVPSIFFGDFVAVGVTHTISSFFVQTSVAIFAARHTVAVLSLRTNIRYIILYYFTAVKRMRGKRTSFSPHPFRAT